MTPTAAAIAGESRCETNAAAMDGAAFRLSCAVAAHTQDVRALAAAAHADAVVSASRDRTVAVWHHPPGTARGLVRTAVFAAHSHFVNALAVVPPSPESPKGLIYSGGSDKIIYAFEPDNAEVPVLTLLGHSENVCALHANDSGILISGSWDKTAKVWQNGVEIYSLAGHSAAVWGVLVVDQNTFLTASADKTIRMWKGAKCVHTFTGHTDVVRSLLLIPNVGFASCSNDGSIRIWDLSGSCLAELYGHTSFVYSLARLPSGEIVSSGEDRTVRVWKDGVLVQTLTQPCISIWCVTAMPNGDIVAGGNDGFIRVFTRSSERVADASEIEAYDKALADSAIPSNQVGDVDKNKLPGLEALNGMGDNDGQVKMVRVGNAVEAHQWSAVQSQWIKIGEVVDAVGSSRKQIHEGKEYDYVFDVDIYEGSPPLKLPFNVNHNPYEAAQKFIDRHELPQGYLDQIANFIIQNTKGISLGTSVPSNQDPYTGTSSSSSGPTGTSGASHAPSASSKLIPMQSYSFFKAINFKAVLGKIVQINAYIEKSMEHCDVALTIDQEQRIERIIRDIEAGKMANFDATDYKVMCKVAFEWPEQDRFPGIDLLRMVVLHTAFPVDADSDFLGTLLRAASLPVQDVSAITKPQETNAMLVIRAITNLFTHKSVLPMLFARREDLVSKTRNLAERAGNKNLRMALATLYLNMIVLIRNQAGNGFDEALGVDLLEILSKILSTETDGDALFRQLVATGTLLASGPSVREAAGLLDISGIVKRACTSAGADEDRLRRVQAEIMPLL